MWLCAALPQWRIRSAGHVGVVVRPNVTVCPLASWYPRSWQPDNLLLDRDGHIKLTDFGLSTFYDGTPLTQKTGTIHYAAPEVLGRAPAAMRAPSRPLCACMPCC